MYFFLHYKIGSTTGTRVATKGQSGTSASIGILWLDERTRLIQTVGSKSNQRIYRRKELENAVGARVQERAESPKTRTQISEVTEYFFFYVDRLIRIGASDGLCGF